MGLLTILLNLKKAWDSLPDAERTAVLQVMEGLGASFAAHSAKMAPPVPLDQASTKGEPRK